MRIPLHLRSYPKRRNPVVDTIDTANPRDLPEKPIKVGCVEAFPKDAVESSEPIVIVLLPVKGRVEKRERAREKRWVSTTPDI
jgi:hypothetical protein